MKKEHMYILASLIVLASIVGCVWAGNASYAQGLSNGVAQGASDGYNAGYTQGKSDGYNQGEHDGYNAGYGQGKSDGYGQGITDGSNGQQDHGIDIEKGRIFSEINNLFCHTNDDGSVNVRFIPTTMNNFKFACR